MSDYVIQLGRLVSYKGKDKNVIIPDGVTTIGRHSFFRSDIESVVIPASVEIVEQEAFKYCNALNNIEILGHIKKVGKDAFDSFYQKEEKKLSVFSAIPIKSFSKAAQEAAIRSFSVRFSEFDSNTDVFCDNLEFIGKHLKQAKEYGGFFYQYLEENEALRHAVLDAGAIPMKDVDWLLAELQKDDNKEFTAELLEYKNRQLQDPKVKEAAEKAKAREEDKALSAEMSAADWRKLLKFGYEDGSVVIKEVMIKEPVVELLDHIGSKKVRVIDRRVFAYNRKKGEKEIWCPEKNILPEGI